MRYKVVIKGRLPGMNEYTEAQRANRYTGGKMKKTAQRCCEFYIAKHIMNVKASKPVVLHYHFYETNRKRDLDNISGFAHKVIQDALVARQVLSDDGWDDIKGYTDSFSVDKKNPRIEVIIEEVE